MSRILASILLIIPIALHSQDISALKFRELGPYRGGRVTSVAGTALEQGTFYLGATGAGVWKTTDYGTTWKNVSDGYFKTPSIGAIAVAKNDPNIVYVGTGSDGLRSNVIAGKGVYKSIDGGETWEHIGLEKAGQIGAVKIHPTNHNIAYVAAIGSAFYNNAERGIYKTINGGLSWEKVLFISEKVGFSDVELMPSNPEILYAGAWKAERKPWTIISGGDLSDGGIYRSVDGGANWQKIDEGMPKPLIGKVDLAVTPADSRIVYALIEAPDSLGGLYKSVDQGQSFTHLSDHEGIRKRPFYYTNIKVDPQDPDKIYALATRYYRSQDGGKNWEMISSPHGDNHDMWINPDNPDLFIQANDGGVNVTFNGGKTWSTQFNQPTAEIYQVEVDDQYPYWVYGGQQDNYSTIAVPSKAPYGLQKSGIGYIMNTGGCETGPAVPKPGDADIVYSNCKGRFGVYDKNTGIEKSYFVGAQYMYGHNPKELKYRFQRVSPIHVSPHDPSTIYHCSQYVHKTTDEGETWETISPDLTAFETDKQVISGSPITRDITGEEFYSTIYAIRESPIEEGLLWVGANDGPVHITKDGGRNWNEVTPKIPTGGRVDAVEPSSHDPASAYISVLRYQLGDPKPYIFKTENLGKNWKLLTTGSNGIPADYPVRVIREDPKREGLLYAGTEYGLFISYDDGENWQALQNNLPVTPITDMKIHRDDLVLSTMGRGFWVLDNISTLRQADLKNITEVTLFKPKNTIRYRYPSGARNSETPSYPRPSVIIDYYLTGKVDSTIVLVIMDAEGKPVAKLTNDSLANDLEEVNVDMSTNEVEYLVNNKLTADKGLNRFHWDMTYPGPWHEESGRRYQRGGLVPPGEYQVRLSVNEKLLNQSFKLLLDPRVEQDGIQDAIDKQVDLQLKVKDLLSKARKMQYKLEKTEDPEQRVSEAIESLKTKEGTYRKPKLIDQIAYLYNMLLGADQLPGRDAYKRFEELNEQFNQLEASL